MALVMRSMGHMVRVPPAVLMPIVLLVTLTAIYVQESNMSAVVIADRIRLASAT